MNGTIQLFLFCRDKNNPKLINITEFNFMNHRLTISVILRIRKERKVIFSTIQHTSKYQDITTQHIYKCNLVNFFLWHSPLRAIFPCDALIFIVLAGNITMKNVCILT